MKTEAQAEHQWLHKLIGDWTYESEMSMGPDQPSEKYKGTESVRPFGDLWVMAEGKGDMPGGEVGRMLMTLGYDPRKKRYVGTWVGSMMPMVWVYEGEVDAGGRVLPLNAEGPSMSENGGTAKYQDVIEFLSDDHRTFTGRMLGDDGKWQTFMTTHYRRKK